MNASSSGAERIKFAMACAVIAVFVGLLVYVNTHDIAEITSADGLSPKNTVSGEDAWLVPESKRQSLGEATMIWLPSLHEGKRCYLSLNVPGATSAFVTVPEDWCKGMR